MMTSKMTCAWRWMSYMEVIMVLDQQNLWTIPITRLIKAPIKCNLIRLRLRLRLRLLLLLLLPLLLLLLLILSTHWILLTKTHVDVPLEVIFLPLTNWRTQNSGFDLFVEGTRPSSSVPKLCPLHPLRRSVGASPSKSPSCFWRQRSQQSLFESRDRVLLNNALASLEM